MTPKPTTKDLWTAAKLSRVARRDRRWVERRIGPVTPRVRKERAAFFAIEDVLPALCADEKNGHEAKEADHRMAALESAREEAEIDLAKKKGELVRAEDVRELWADWLARARVVIQSSAMPDAEKVRVASELARCAELTT